MTLNLEQLTKTFDENEVLKHIDLSLKDFEALVIIGISGGGKTTLLRMLAGLEMPTKGTVHINQHTLQYNDKIYMRNYRRNIGMVFQAYNLFPHLTALENIVLPLTQVHNFSRDEAHEKAIELFDRFQLTPHMKKKPAQLSGGQQQRIAISRAIAPSPEFLLLDEPTSALDPEMTSEVIDILKDIRDLHIQFIMVTHNMFVARNIADYVLFMHKGIIQEHAASQLFFDKPKTPELQQFLSKIV